MPNIDRRNFLTHSASLGLGLTALPTLAMGQQGMDDREAVAADLVTRKTQQAIDRGLGYLARRQNEDGSFGDGGYSRNVAICSLAGMAFMAAGSTPGRGKYGENVTHCVKYIIENADPESGFIASSGSVSHGPMYGHGFATLFLAEVYGMSSDTMVRERLEKAVKLIVASQSMEGGWRYTTDSADSDISVTICQIMALRAARNAGIFVPKETVQLCIDYVKRSQNADGGFMYRIEGGPSGFPRSAAGVVALYSAGIYGGDEVRKGLDYLMQHIPRADTVGRESHYYYGQYYAVQAMWHAGGKRWQRWYPAIRNALLKNQRDDGSWMDSICPEYGTAMASIVLQMPNNYLPIFQA